MLKGERSQPSKHVFKFMFQVFFNKELRVSKTRLDDLFVAIGDHIQVLFAPIAHGDEVVHQVSLQIVEREVSLVLLHHRNEHFRWELQVRWVKTPEQRGWSFDKLDNFIQQGRIHLFGRADFGLLACHLCCYHRTALLRIKEDALRPQRCLIFRGAANSKSFWLDEAQPTRLSSR